MTDRDNEILIRQAVAAEADEAVDAATVLARLHQRTRSRRRSTILVAAAALAVTAGVAAVVVPLAMTRETPAPTAGVADAPAPAQSAEPNILLLGLDRQEGNSSVRTDSVVLVRAGGGTVRAVNLPRDSWVDVPGKGMDKLNNAYLEGRQAAVSQGRDAAAADAEGAKRAVATVQALTGVRIDHYAAVDLAGFGRLSTAIGGVEVCLKAATSDEYAGADFRAGKQTLTGAQALAFVRQRHGLPNSDLDRIVRQQAFLRAVVDKAAKGKVLSNPDAVAALLAAVKANVQVDQGWDLAAFAQQLTSVSGVEVATIPVLSSSNTGPSRGSLLLDAAAVRTFTANFLAGTAPRAPAPGTPAPNAGPSGMETQCVN